MHSVLLQLRSVQHLVFAKLCALVEVNDVSEPAVLIREITAQGGKAIGIKASLKDGDIIVNKTIAAFGRINTSTVQEDCKERAMTEMDDGAWNGMVSVYLCGMYKLTKAAWPYLLKHKHGKIVSYPLHVNPAFAAKDGFQKPILHGPASSEWKGRYDPFKSIDVRFAETVNPGETVVTDMRTEKKTVIFQTKVKELGKLVLVAAAVKPLDGGTASKL